MELFDRARVKRDKDEVRGNYISYDTRAEVYRVQGAKELPAAPAGREGRVRATIQPKKKEDAARAARAGARPETRAGPRGGPPVNEPLARATLAAPPRPDRASRLRTAALNKRYKKRTVVRDVSLEVMSGEVVGLLGPNGAGKTTCFYMIVGLVAADGGRIFVEERDITRLPIHRRARLGLSYLPQEASVFRRLTVQENVRAVLELMALEPDEVEARLDELLGELHIAHLRDAPALSLSGGERRRVEICRALATRPAFILLDEPFAGVDPIAVLDIQRIIRFLRERGIGVLITDHNVRETLGICDRAYIINEGSVLASGKPEEIVYNENVRRVYLGEHFRL